MGTASEKLREDMLEAFRKPSRAVGATKLDDSDIKDLKLKKSRVVLPAIEDPVVEVKPTVSDTDKVLYSDLTAEVVTSNAKVKVFDPEEWNEEVRNFIPSPYTEYMYREEDYAVAQLLEAGELVCLVGDPGCGKDYMVRQYAALTNRPYQRIMGMRNVTPDMLLGKFTLVDGNMHWMPGTVEMMVRHGGVLVLSEIAGMNPDTTYAFQSLMERGGFLTLMEHPDPTQRMLKPHKDFRLVITSNVRGVGDNIDKYSATSVMDASTLNRIESMVEIPYLTKNAEITLLQKHAGISATVAKRMVEVGALIRESCRNGTFEGTWSPRNLLAWGRVAAMFDDVAKGFKFTYYGKLSDVEKSTVRNYWRTVGFTQEI